MSDAAPVKLSELMAKPNDYVGKVVKVEGLVTEVCPKRGCWINVAGDKEFQTIKVKVEDGVIVFPLTDKGKKVVAEGTLKKMELTKEQAIERAKHEAEEKGTSFDPASITGPRPSTRSRGSAPSSSERSSDLNWRRLNNVLHRDLGYLAAGLTLVYAISGVAVNHRHQWNPSWKVDVETRTFEPVPVEGRDTMTAALVERLALPGPPKSVFRSAPHLVELFYEGWSVKADATAGTATIEKPRGRVALREMNFLHLNEPKRLWTWAADAYAVVLAFLADLRSLRPEGERTACRGGGSGSRVSASPSRSSRSSSSSGGPGTPARAERGRAGVADGAGAEGRGHRIEGLKPRRAAVARAAGDAGESGIPRARRDVRQPDRRRPARALPPRRPRARRRPTPAGRPGRGEGAAPSSRGWT